MGMTACAFIDPTLAVRLTSLGMGENAVGIVFAVMGVSWGIGAAFGAWLCRKLTRQIVMQTGFVFLAGSCFLVGPSMVLGFPESIYLVLIGVQANWFFGSWLVMPVTSEVIDSATVDQKQKWTEDLKN